MATTLYNFNFGKSGTLTSFVFSSDDEGQSDYDFELGTGLGSVYNIFNGTSNVFTSIWCEPTASLTSGRFYATRTTDLSIVKNSKVVDYYTTERQGASEDTLDSGDIVDISVSF